MTATVQVMLTVAKTTAEMDFPKEAWTALWDCPPQTWTVHGVTGKVLKIDPTNRMGYPQVRLTLEVSESDAWKLLGQEVAAATERRRGRPPKEEQKKE